MRVLPLALIAALVFPAAASAQSTAQKMLDTARQIRAAAQSQRTPVPARMSAFIPGLPCHRAPVTSSGVCECFVKSTARAMLALVTRYMSAVRACKIKNALHCWTQTSRGRVSRRPQRGVGHR